MDTAMIHVNENYLKIQASYLFTEIAHRVKAHQDAHPDAKIIRLGIGDVGILAAGKKLLWDGTHITNDAASDARLEATYRKGWELEA